MQRMQPEQNILLQLRIMELSHKAEAARFQVRTPDAHASVTHAPSLRTSHVFQTPVIKDRAQCHSPGNAGAEINYSTY
jgi:hypothetical protein